MIRFLVFVVLVVLGVACLFIVSPKLVLLTTVVSGVGLLLVTIIKDDEQGIEL